MSPSAQAALPPRPGAVAPWWGPVRLAILALGAAPLMAQQAPEPPVQAPRGAQPMPVPRALIGHRGAAKIFIDGSLQDWPGGVPLVLDDPRQLSGTAMGAWRGPEDLRARVFMVWDAADLFVAAVVEDDWHRPLAPTSPRLGEIPPADSVLLSFDPRRDTRTIGPDSGREEDREFWLADVGGESRQVVLWDRLRGTARHARGAVAVAQRDQEEGRTIYEARLPWREILPAGMEPAAGQVVDCQVVVNDYDEITDTMAQTRIGWTFGSGVRIDPGLRGSLMLVEEVARYREMPAFPSPPERPTPRGEEYWVDLSRTLAATEPTAIQTDSGPPEVAIGAARLEVLERLDDELARFPRNDFLDYHHRVHRRMRRECGGMISAELPFFWQETLRDLARRLSVTSLDDGVRVFRLPVGGWIVCTPKLALAIDAAGYDLEGQVVGALAAALLTQPGDMTKRNDQMLLRLSAAKRPFCTHRSFHLPGVDGARMPRVTIGETIDAGGAAKITVVGTQDGDLVSPTVGYVITCPDGTVVVHSGMSMTPAQLVAAVPDPGRVDLLILSARHPQAVELAAAVDVRLVVLDDVLQCAIAPGVAGRISLQDAFALQAALRPHSSMIVGPGESVDIASGH